MNPINTFVSFFQKPQISLSNTHVGTKSTVKKKQQRLPILDEVEIDDKEVEIILSLVKVPRLLSPIMELSLDVLQPPDLSTGKTETTPFKPKLN